MFNQTSEIHKARSKHLKKRKRGTKKCINSPGRNVIDQAYSITKSVGPDFQTKKVSWASYFSGEATRNDTF